MRDKKNLDRLLIFDEGDRICFFDSYMYKIGDIVCLPVNGKDAIYVIDSIAQSASELKTDYARGL